jgi:beta-glucosidase
MTSFPNPADLPIAQLIAQLMVVRTTGFLFDRQLQYPQWEADLARLQKLIQTDGIGSVILLGGSAAEVGLKTQQMQAWATLPLLICADIEEGVGQRFSGATWFPPPMALGGMAQRDLPGAITQAEAMGQATAQEALAIGINWLLTPTVDVNNNPANPVINVRAFGETPEIVIALTMAYIKGAQKEGAITTAKHFPGHGDTATDSHWNLPVIHHDRDRLNAVELAPFRQAIEAGVDTIMGGHLIVPALDDGPTTFSKAVMGDLLRGELGFEGLVVTDAMVMGAIADGYGNGEAVVRAIEAGHDVIMMPVEVEGAIEAVIEAVETGRITRSRIEASVARIFKLKQRMALPTNIVDAEWLQRTQAQDGSAKAVERIMYGSLEVRRSAPLDLRPGWRNIVLTDNLLASPFLHRMAPAIVIPQSKGGETRLLDCAMGLGEIPNGWEAQDAIMQIFLRGNPLRGIESALAQAKLWLGWLGQTGQLRAVVVYGSPYVAADLKLLVAAEVAWVFCYGQMGDAQTIALGELWKGDEGGDRGKEGMFA